MSSVSLFELVLLLLAIVIPLELVARRLRLPPAAAQILAGMGLAFVPVEHRVQLDPDLILVLFLPPLLMSSAFFTVWRDFRTNISLIAALAVGAVAFTTAVVGVVTHLVLPSLPWAVCFALGAIVSPPDALAAKAVLQRVTLPPRLLVLLEGESLVNDASGLVLFRLAVAAALTGSFSFGEALTSFAVLSVGGIAMGLLIGWIATVLLTRLHETPILAVATLLTAWASYIIADRLGTSGVLSTVACGLVMGWRQHELLSAAARTSSEAVWRAVEFVLESLVFVLIGLSLREVLLGQELAIGELWPAIVAVVAAVILSRFAWVFGTGYGSNLLGGRRQSRPPAAVLVVASWAGMRGVVSLAIALSLPESLPGRDFILLTTFVVILVTVLGQGSTLGPLIRMLRLPSVGISKEGHVGAGVALLGEVEARLRVADAQLAAVQALAYDKAGVLQHPRLLEQYQYRQAVIRRVQETVGGMPGARAAHFDLIVAAVAAGRAELLRLHRSGAIHDNVLRALESELDLEELAARRRRGS
ncbi:MAG: sodium:proton antiporter [Pseudomonadota bacterium]|nr:sodium:proton antiporter [Pseudomonadota bacterium]